DGAGAHPAPPEGAGRHEGHRRAHPRGACGGGCRQPVGAAAGATPDQQAGLSSTLGLIQAPRSLAAPMASSAGCSFFSSEVCPGCDLGISVARRLPLCARSRVAAGRGRSTSSSLKIVRGSPRLQSSSAMLRVPGPWLVALLLIATLACNEQGDSDGSGGSNDSA